MALPPLNRPSGVDWREGGIKKKFGIAVKKKETFEAKENSFFITFLNDGFGVLREPK